MRCVACDCTDRTGFSTALPKVAARASSGPQTVAHGCAELSRTYVPLSEPRSIQSRGSCQTDVRPLAIKEPGRAIRDGHALHLGHVFVPIEHRGKGLSAGINRDLRALLHSRTLAPPLDAIDLVYGQAEPKLNRICACRHCDWLSGADGQAQWHRFQVYSLELREPLTEHPTAFDHTVEILHVRDAPAIAKVLATRLRARMAATTSDKTLCAIVPTADAIEHRCVGQLCTLNQIRGEQVPVTQIGGRIGDATNSDVAMSLRLPWFGESGESSLA